MATPKFFVHFYRDALNDTSVITIPPPTGSLEGAKEFIARQLLDHFQNEGISASKRPSKADMLSEDGKIISRFSVKRGDDGSPKVVEFSEE